MMLARAQLRGSHSSLPCWHDSSLLKLPTHATAAAAAAVAVCARYARVCPSTPRVSGNSLCLSC